MYYILSREEKKADKISRYWIMLFGREHKISGKLCFSIWDTATVNCDEFVYIGETKFVLLKKLMISNKYHLLYFSG